MQDPFKCKVKNQTYQLNTGLGSLGLDQRENTATGVLSSLKFQVENIKARIRDQTCLPSHYYKYIHILRDDLEINQV